MIYFNYGIALNSLTIFRKSGPPLAEKISRRKKMKRSVILDALELAEKERRKLWQTQNAEVLKKLADLKTAIINFLPQNPEDLISLDALEKLLKPSKIVCKTLKKFESKKPAENTENSCAPSKCGGCKSSCGENSKKCECENTPNLCPRCMNFLARVLNIMIDLKEIDGFVLHLLWLGRHKE